MVDAIMEVAKQRSDSMVDRHKAEDVMYVIGSFEIAMCLRLQLPNV